MKTQLQEDFDESGSAPSRAPPPIGVQTSVSAPPFTSDAAPLSAPPLAQTAAPAEKPAAPRPAVWQRPRQVEAAAEPAGVATPVPERAQAGSPASSPVPPAVPPSRPPVQAPVHPRGFAPQPIASGTTTVPLGDTTAPAWPPGADADWLTERLARDAALQERTEWSGLWKRRLASWGAASVLLALLAGGGLWLYEQSRVEGALVVVANTNPVPEAQTVRPASIPAPAAVRISPPVATVDSTESVVAPAAVAPAATAPAASPLAQERSGTAAVGGTAGPSTAAGAAEAQTPVFADRSVVPVATDVDPPAKPKHKRNRTVRRAQADTSAEAGENERSYRQRYEETLMQCRAHGYDDRQCLRRGCEMTRYGFACKG